MIKAFLRAKHWQLFLLMFGIPLVFQCIVFGKIFAQIISGQLPSPTYLFNYMKFFPLYMIICTSVFFGWFWSVVIGLQAKIPEEAKFKLTRFKILFFIPLIYIYALSILIGGVLGNMMQLASIPDSEMLGILLYMIVPLHLFSMFCIFHSLYFVAKTVKTVELQRITEFSDFAGEFFMIWFYPIGIWIIQPKINEMNNEDTDNAKNI